MRGGAGANGKADLDGTVTASGRQPPVLTVDSHIHVGMREKLKVFREQLALPEQASGVLSLDIMTPGIETVISSLATMDRLRVHTFLPRSLTR